MRGKRKSRAVRREITRAARSDATDPDACECGHHAGLPAAWHLYFCPISAALRHSYANARRGL